MCGDGIVGMTMSCRPNSYDHHRAVQHTQGLGDRPPVWDFKIRRVDGTEMLVHPRWKKKAKTELIILADVPTQPTLPVRGAGKSDGPGTYRRATGALYTDRAPAPPKAPPVQP